MSAAADAPKRPAVQPQMPGPRTKALVERDHKVLATVTKTAPIAIERAEGAWLHGIDGDTWLDFCSSGAVVSTGHAHPKVVKAIQEQAPKFLHFMGTDFYYDLQVKVAERLAAIAPGDFEKKVFFCNSGAESVEAAMKLAKWSTRRGQFLAFQGAFHGRTLGALSLTASKRVQRARYFPTIPGITHVPFPNPYRNPWGIDGYANPEDLVKATMAYLEENVLDALLPPDEVAAVVVEPIQGEGGYVVPPRGFLPALHKLTQRHGMLLVADEVQTGNGRTGAMYAVEHSGVAPEVLITAKGVASGMPMGAAIFKADLDWGKDGAHSNTYGGNPVVMAASLATLEVIEEEGLVANAAKVGEHMGKRLRELQGKHEAIGDARGIGLMQALDFVQDRRSKAPDAKFRDAVEELALRRGVLLLGCGKSALRFAPPLVVTEAQVDTVIDIVDGCIKDAAKA